MDRMSTLALDSLRKEKTFTLDTELKARRFMDVLDTNNIKYSYWHRSICEHIITIKDFGHVGMG